MAVKLWILLVPQKERTAVREAGCDTCTDEEGCKSPRTEKREVVRGPGLHTCKLSQKFGGRGKALILLCGSVGGICLPF